MIAWIEKYIMPSAAGAIAGIGAWLLKLLFTRQKAQQEQQENIKNGMLALMHDRIFAIYGECSRKKYATVEDIRNLEYLYKPYHDLGGNGTGTELFERVKKMPTEPPQSTTA